MTEYRVGIHLDEYGYPIERYPVEKTLAESTKYISKRNLHEVSISVPITKDGHILSIMRNKNLRVHPGKYSAPAGHVNVIDNNGLLELESPLNAIDRELFEETNLESKYTNRILED